MFQGLLLPLFPAEHISCDYIFLFLVILCPYLLMTKTHDFPCPMSNTPASLCGSWPQRQETQWMQMQVGLQGMSQVGSRAWLWDGVGLRRLCRAETLRLPPAPRPTQSHRMQPWQQSTFTALSLLTRHLHTKDWRLAALYHLSHSSFSLSYFFFLSDPGLLL